MSSIAWGKSWGGSWGKSWGASWGAAAATDVPSQALLSSFSWPQLSGAARNIAREAAASTRRGQLAGARHALRIR